MLADDDYLAKFYSDVHDFGFLWKILKQKSDNFGKGREKNCGLKPQKRNLLLFFVNKNVHCLFFEIFLVNTVSSTSYVRQCCKTML